MIIQQATEIMNRRSELVSRRSALTKARTIFTTVFNGDVAGTLQAAGLSEGATLTTVEKELKAITAEMVAMPSIPMNVFKAIKK